MKKASSEGAKKALEKVGTQTLEAGMKRLGDEAGKYAGEKIFIKKAPTPKPHGDIIIKELTKDQEKNANFEARLSRLIAGAGKNNIIYYNIVCSDLKNIVIVMNTYQSS